MAGAPKAAKLYEKEKKALPYLRRVDVPEPKEK
jgi:hypothetical protein